MVLAFFADDDPCAQVILDLQIQRIGAVYDLSKVQCDTPSSNARRRSRRANSSCAPFRLALPPEEYDWFDVHAHLDRRGEARRSDENGKVLGALPEDQVLGASEPNPRQSHSASSSSTQDRSSVSLSRPRRAHCRERLPLFQSAAARSV